MKTINKIPVSKIQRASNIVKTGIKVGGNYAKYYSKKVIGKDDHEELDKENAKDIYEGLKELKGSVLKVAQMMSMEKNILPTAYIQEFTKAQYSVPPISGPLVRKTFKKYLGKYPEEVFDSFENTSHKAASIGQVHVATKNGKKLAVKIQYPGVAESISSDLALVKPFALKMFKMDAKDAEKYFKEVESKLIEETQYLKEVEESIDISEKCKANVENVVFPEYYRELTSEKIITMSWLEGIHLDEWQQTERSQEERNKIAQALWDFYMYQMHVLHKVHADPHPGNFLITEDNQLGALDFGCIKEIEPDFYEAYFALTQKAELNDSEKLIEHLTTLEMLLPKDSPKVRELIQGLFSEVLGFLSTPFQSETFDFGDKEFFKNLYRMGSKYAHMPEMKKMDHSRGSRHLLYMNRTMFGLFNLLHDMQGIVKTRVPTS